MKPLVVLLHGLARGHGSMAKLDAFLRAHGFETWRRSYPSRRHSIAYLATALTEQLVEVAGERPLCGVTHSLGGIVVRHLRDPRLHWSRIVMLAPPGTEGWASRLGSLVRPLRLPGFVDDAMARGAAERAEIQQALDERTLDAEAMTLAPLFERHDATQVAAALLALWSARRTRPAAASAPSGDREPASARIWVSVGQRDQATPGDLVAALVKELGVDRSHIGKIELRESFTLVELPAGEAERIAERLTGVMIRRRKVAARLDKGAKR